MNVMSALAVVVALGFLSRGLAADGSSILNCANDVRSACRSDSSLCFCGAGGRISRSNIVQVAQNAVGKCNKDELSRAGVPSCIADVIDFTTQCGSSHIVGCVASSGLMSSSFNATKFGSCMLMYALVLPQKCKDALQDVALDIADRMGQAARSAAANRGRPSPPASSQTQQWVKFNNFEYKWYGSYQQWTAAENTCKRSGAHLASLHSDAEDNFIKTKVIPSRKKWVFFGYSDADDEGHWVWSDGTASDYEPTFVDGKDNIGGRRWNKREGDCSAWNNADTRFPRGIQDVSCLHRLTFVCKRPATAGSSTSATSPATSTATSSARTHTHSGSHKAPYAKGRGSGIDATPAHKDKTSQHGGGSTIALAFLAGVAALAVPFVAFKVYQRLRGDKSALAHHELTLRNAAQTPGQAPAPAGP